MLNAIFQVHIIIQIFYFLDRRLEDEIEVFEKIIHSRTKNVIGSTSVFLEGVDQSCRLRECNFGNFVLDSFVNYVSYDIKYCDYYLVFVISKLDLIEYKNKF